MIDVGSLAPYTGAFWQGTLITLQITFLGCCIGIILGTILGVIQSSSRGMLYWIVSAYTTIMRGTPMLIQIAFIYFLLPEIGLNLSDMACAILAVGLNSAAYVGQIIKSGITAVPKGQYEAAQVLGFSHSQTIRFIVLPQAIRTILPALGNELTTLVKESSLASTIGIMELSKQAIYVQSRTFNVFGVYCVVACIYLIITSVLSLFVNYLERRMNRHANN